MTRKEILKGSLAFISRHFVQPAGLWLHDLGMDRQPPDSHISPFSRATPVMLRSEPRQWKQDEETDCLGARVSG